MKASLWSRDPDPLQLWVSRLSIPSWVTIDVNFQPVHNGGVGGCWNLCNHIIPAQVQRLGLVFRYGSYTPAEGGRAKEGIKKDKLRHLASANAKTYDLNAVRVLCRADYWGPRGSGQ